MIDHHFSSFLARRIGGEGPGALVRTGKLLKWEAEISPVWEGVNWGKRLQRQWPKARGQIGF